jgi:hypothetical protein
MEREMRDMNQKGRGRIAATIGALVASALLLPAAASAYQTAPGWTASDYATGFPFFEGGVGPAGLVFDGQANLLAADAKAGALYKVPPGGGDASNRRLADGLGQLIGLAWDLDNRLFVARRDRGDVVELNPADGTFVRTVATGLPCPVGLATDPISGDLFVANNECANGGIMRIRNHNSTPAMSRYAGTQDGDGLTFGPDGTLYAAEGDAIYKVSGTSSSQAGKSEKLATVPHADGIVYSPASTAEPAYLVVNRTDGEIDRVEMDGSTAPIVTQGTRGDLVTVGPDRCIYATLQDRVIKVGPSVGSCSFAAPPQPGIDPNDAGAVLGERTGRVVDTAVKVAARKTVKRGALYTLTLKAANHGRFIARKVKLVARLAAGERYARARIAKKTVACKRKSRTITCSRATLKPGASFSVKVIVRAVRGSRYVNRATVKSADLDPKPGNNTSRSKTKVKG